MAKEVASFLTVTLEKEVEKMLKKAIIISIQDNKAQIDLLPDDCHKSSSCKGCGMCGNREASEELLKLEVETITGLKCGEVVNIELSSPRRSIIAITLFTMPLFLMFIAGYMGNTYFQDIGMILGGAIGLFSSIIVIYILNKTILKLRGRIISVV